MPNHSNNSDIIVVKGTAPLDDLSQMKKFKMKPVLLSIPIYKYKHLPIYKTKEQTYPKTIPGYNVAVRKAARFHSRPFIVL